MKKTTLVQLKEQIAAVKNIRNLFRDQKRWYIGAEAVDKNGEDASPSGKNAVRWCLIGGLKKYGQKRTTFGIPGQVIDLNDDLDYDDPDGCHQYISVRESLGDRRRRILHRRVMLFLDFNLLAMQDEYKERVSAANKKIYALLKGANSSE